MSAFLPLVRRILGSLALAVVLVCGVAMVNEEIASFVFIPSWIAGFFAWPYVSRKLDSVSLAALRSRPGHPAIRGGLFIPGMVALAVAYGVAVCTDAQIFAPTLLFCWIALYFAWPFVIRRLPFLNLSKPAAPSPAVVNRPLWRRFVRGTLVFVGRSGLVLFLMSLIVIVPISLSFARAKKVHNSIHAGMRLEEVFNTA